jgi:uncharacterized protein (TIGR03435 family)
MLQALLAERFQLRIRRETKTIPVYELIVRKNAAKLPRSEDPNKEGSLRVVDDSFVFENVTMSEFAARLTDLAGIDRPVLDKTGMAGVYDVTLKSAARRDAGGPFVDFFRGGRRWFQTRASEGTCSGSRH